jgi:hypothetical protein
LVPNPVAFFSYSREDSEFALRLANDLKAAGSAVWIDQLDIGPGERWDRVVQQALESCPSVLIILSPASVNSNNVMDEVSFALDQQKAIIPVLYRDCDIPFRIRRFQHVDFRNNYEHMLEELKRCLHLATSSAPAGAPAPPKIETPRPPVSSTPDVARTDIARSVPASSEPSRPSSSYTDTSSTASSFPAWAKIAIPIAVVVIAVVAYMLMSSGSSKHENTDNRQPVVNKADNGASDTGSTNRAALGSVELLGTGLAATQSSTPCALPANSESKFGANDPGAWFFFSFRHGDPGDQWSVDWIEPNGYVHKTNAVPHAGNGGRYCFEMKIAGTPAQNAPGEWTVRLNRNGTEVAERKFTISK